MHTIVQCFGIIKIEKREEEEKGQKERKKTREKKNIYMRAR